MPDFNTYIARHGEFGVQALIERMERYEGVRSSIGTSLEERWQILMQPTPAAQFYAAA